MFGTSVLYVQNHVLQSLYSLSYPCLKVALGEVCTGFWWKNLKERDHWGDPKPRWEDNIKADLQKVGYGVWTGLSWLRIETGGGQL
jgi:hypothetical protein